MTKEEQLSSTVEIIIRGSEKINELIFIDDNVSKATFFEGIIFNSIKILDELKISIPKDYPKVKGRFYYELFTLALTEGYGSLLPSIPGDIISFIDFIDIRENQYSINIDSETDFKRLLSILVNNFYENPLIRSTDGSHNLMLILTLSQKMKSIIDFQKDCASVIIEKCQYSEDFLVEEKKRLSQQKANEDKKEGCYIATMVYGEYDHPQVLELRKYRDNSLRKTILGHMFIKFYYRYSPTLVMKLKDKKNINKLIKVVLDNFIKMLN